MSIRDALRKIIAGETELNRIFGVTSRNNVTSKYAEYIAINALSMTPARPGSKGFDASHDIFNKVQIKGIGHGGNRTGAIRCLDFFDNLVVVMFDEAFNITGGYIIPKEQIEVGKPQCSYSNHTSSWIITIPKTIPPVWKNITDQLLKFQNNDQQ